MRNKFYITTPIYYVNAKPHIGHAYTTVAADVLSRWNKQQGKETFFLTGTDEHGIKIQKKAEEEKKNPQEFVDEISREFKKLWRELDIRYDGFIKTTDENHKKTVQKVLQSLYNKGVIYKGTYEGLYCMGCEQFKSENELVNGKCPDHGTVPKMMKEECYLLKMSEKQNELIEKIKSGEFEIAPEKYKKEILSFLDGQKLQDVSISRKNVSWGISLPFDKGHTAYVWADAFLNYLTGLGWNGTFPLSSEHLSLKEGESNHLNFWPADIQLIGKDILRVHATIWPVMLLHLGLPLPKKIFVHGHLLSSGKKMSKTLGNIIGIDEMIKKFGVDGTRYLLMSAGTFGEDIDVTIERMAEKYNADLANGLGNLVSRVVTLATNLKSQISNPEQISDFRKEIQTNDKLYPLIDEFDLYMHHTEISKALKYIWNIVCNSNKYIEENKPWELVKTDEKKFGEVMEKLIQDLYLISELLIPFMPETAEKIKKALETKKLDKVLFERIKV